MPLNIYCLNKNGKSKLSWLNYILRKGEGVERKLQSRAEGTDFKHHGQLVESRAMIGVTSNPP